MADVIREIRAALESLDRAARLVGWYEDPCMAVPRDDQERAQADLATAHAEVDAAIARELEAKDAEIERMTDALAFERALVTAREKVIDSYEERAQRLLECERAVERFAAMAQRFRASAHECIVDGGAVACSVAARLVDYARTIEATLEPDCCCGQRPNECVSGCYEGEDGDE